MNSAYDTINVDDPKKKIVFERVENEIDHLQFISHNQFFVIRYVFVT